jgi:hypothetical protein
MAHPTEIDLATKGGEAMLRALLEDLVEDYRGVRPSHRLALAVWFGKGSGDPQQNLLMLFTGTPMKEVLQESLSWTTGLKSLPIVHVQVDYTSVAYFLEQLRMDSPKLRPYTQNYEVLDPYVKKDLLDVQILNFFKVITEPSGLMKGWYVGADEYARCSTLRKLHTSFSQLKPEIAVVKIGESEDFENCRGLLHVEVNQRWIPLSPGTLSTFAFYNDSLDRRPGYFLFEGGSLYQILKVEVKKVPEYADRVLQRLRDDRYAEVYLRAVPLPERTAA